MLNGTAFMRQPWPRGDTYQITEDGYRGLLFIKPDQFPFATQMGAVYDSGDYGKALDLALKTADWKRLKEERDAARAEGRPGSRPVPGMRSRAATAFGSRLRLTASFKSSSGTVKPKSGDSPPGTTIRTR